MSVEDSELLIDSAADVVPFLSRLRRPELLEYCAHRGLDDVPGSITKRDLVVHVLRELFADGLNHGDASDMDMFYWFRRGNAKRWAAMEKTEWTREPVSLDSFRKNLGDFFPCHVSETIRDGIHWIRVCIPVPLQVVFVLHCQRSPYILVSTVKKDVSQFLFSSLCVAFHCTSLTECKLSGKNISSLFDLLHYQESQGAFRSARESNSVCNVLSHKREQRRELVTREDEKDEEDEWLIEAELEARNKRRRVADNSYGKGEQPELQRVDIQVELRDGGKLNVKIEGISVLDGISNLIRNGYVKTPVSPLLESLHSQGKNRFVVVEQGQEV